MLIKSYELCWNVASVFFLVSYIFLFFFIGASDFYLTCVFFSERMKHVYCQHVWALSVYHGCVWMFHRKFSPCERVFVSCIHICIFCFDLVWFGLVNVCANAIYVLCKTILCVMAQWQKLLWVSWCYRFWCLHHQFYQECAEAPTNQPHFPCIPLLSKNFAQRYYLISVWW